MSVRAIVLRAAGINCEQEMVRAFRLAGAEADLVHLSRLVEEPALLGEYDLIGFPGGFSFGDDIASGRVFAVILRERLYPALREAAMRGVPMIGACNGFQVMTQVGLLPGPTDPAAWPKNAPTQTCALAENLFSGGGGRFLDRWVRVEVPANTRCVWTRALLDEAGRPRFSAEEMMLPIAHGEGRFVADLPETLRALETSGRVALRYAAGDNPNGSEGDVAGICDASGLIFGLMPHPERYTDRTLHPFWTRLGAGEGETPGLAMFRAAVEHAGCAESRAGERLGAAH